MDKKKTIEYIWWLWTLVHRGVIEKSDLHRECGNLFEFPKCCIDNYIRLEEAGKVPGVYMDSLFGKDDLSDIWRNPRVRCEKCRKPINLGS